VEHIEIPPHVQRLREEHEQTEQRLRKLKAFIADNPIFHSLEEAERHDMIEQTTVMNSLEKILSRRLERALAKL
jgi:ribosomal protein S4